MTDQRKAPAGGAARGGAVFRSEPAHFTPIPPIEKLLPRLEGVKVTGPRKWIARCPSHPDKRPSLSIREAEDNTVLLKCWSGCGGADVVEAVGLKLHDLFPRKLENRPALRPGERWIPRDALLALAHELLVAAIIIAAAQDGAPIPPADLDRLAQITGRLRAAAREVGAND